MVAAAAAAAAVVAAVVAAAAAGALGAAQPRLRSAPSARPESTQSAPHPACCSPALGPAPAAPGGPEPSPQLRCPYCARGALVSRPGIRCPPAGLGGASAIPRPPFLKWVLGEGWMNQDGSSQGISLEGGPLGLGEALHRPLHFCARLRVSTIYRKGATRRRGRFLPQPGKPLGVPSRSTSAPSQGPLSASLTIRRRTNESEKRESLTPSTLLDVAARTQHRARLCDPNPALRSQGRGKNSLCQDKAVCSWVPVPPRGCYVWSDGGEARASRRHPLSAQGHKVT